MYEINFKNKYKVIHINNELGNSVIGGAGTYMNELYKNSLEDTGFVFLNLEEAEIKETDFIGLDNVLVLEHSEKKRLLHIECDIIVIQFYEFAYYLTSDLIRNKKIVYVIHSVPTPEPMPGLDPFGGNVDVREKSC